MKHQHEALAGFPVVTTFPVLWGDQDPFGHVNNLVYLRWCESVRVEYLERVGMWVPLPPQGVGPILASIHCDYKLPLNYPDTVHVGARVTRIGNSSMVTKMTARMAMPNSRKKSQMRSLTTRG